MISFAAFHIANARWAGVGTGWALLASGFVAEAGVDPCRVIDSV